MGGGSWTRDAYVNYASTTISGKKTSEVFRSRSVASGWNVKDVLIRESRDSEEHPNSVPIVIGLDVTGSMGIIPDNLVRDGLPRLMDMLMNPNSSAVPIVSDPQVMCVGIGDVRYDSSPIQASQFESDVRIVKQLTELFIEKGGGGNQTESYDVAWLFAGGYTATDAWDKRQKKGYCFTVGDELPPTVNDTNTGVSLEKRLIERHLTGIQVDMTAEAALSLAQEKYAVFHLVIEQGRGMDHIGRDRVISEWKELLGNNAVLVNDYTKLPEVISSVIRVCEGQAVDDVVESFRGTDSYETVKRALTA